MAYLYSNEPYQRVDDGIGAGLVGGAAIGGAMAGAAHLWGKQGISALSGLNQNIAVARGIRAGVAADAMDTSNVIPFNQNQTTREAVTENAHNRIGSQHERVGKGLNKLSEWHSKGFGGTGKARALAYGGSVLAGSLLGAGIDYLND